MECFNQDDIGDIGDSNYDRAKKEIFSDISSMLNNTNFDDWKSVITRAKSIINISEQLLDNE